MRRKYILLHFIYAGLLCLVYLRPVPANGFSEYFESKGINQCTDAEVTKAAMEKVYTGFLAKISPADQTILQLQLSLEAWGYRVNQLEFNNVETGCSSIRPTIFSEYYPELPNTYTKLLEMELHCQQGSFFCVTQ